MNTSILDPHSMQGTFFYFPGFLELELWLNCNGFLIALTPKFRGSLLLKRSRVP